VHSWSVSPLDETADLPWRRDADRVRQHDLGGREPRSKLGDDAGIDVTFEGTAEGNADRDRHR